MYITFMEYTYDAEIFIGTYINYMHVAHLDGIHRSKKLMVQVYGKFIYIVHTHMYNIHMVHRFMANTY
jgi:hypothetical protein